MERREAHPFNSRLAACASLAKDARPAALHRGDFCPRDRNFRARTKGGESCPDRGGRSPPVGARKLRSRGQKSPRWSAEWRACRSQGTPTPQGVRLMVAPLGAPFPRVRPRAKRKVRRSRKAKAEGTTAHPAPLK